ncbi:MAG: SBBP repeat-containing protein [Calditrichae bacterium]|nr:SBBP repeat-containing protein [Calditrichia bacterium]
MDRNGNVYVTGHTYSYPSQYDIVTCIIIAMAYCNGLRDITARIMETTIQKR